MNELALLSDLHKDAHRQGPGGDSETEKAIRLAGLDQNTPLKLPISVVALAPQH